jgi:hypothetical protein
LDAEIRSSRLLKKEIEPPMPNAAGYVDSAPKNSFFDQSTVANESFELLHPEVPEGTQPVFRLNRGSPRPQLPAYALHLQQGLREYTPRRARRRRDYSTA